MPHARAVFKLKAVLPRHNHAPFSLNAL